MGGDGDGEQDGEKEDKTAVEETSMEEGEEREEIGNSVDSVLRVMDKGKEKNGAVEKVNRGQKWNDNGGT